MRSGIVLAALLSTLCVLAPAAAAQDSEGALAIERELGRIAGGRVLWPGFDPLTIPLAVYAGERTYLFRHPSPPEGFSELEGARPRTFFFEGRHPAVVANATAEIGGTVTATLLAEGARPGEDATALAAVALHEAFHVYQRARHPGWSANEGDLFVYPVDDARLLVLRRLESRALHRALEAGGLTEARCWARAALAFRDERFDEMDSAFSTYERRTELFEGLATYVQRLAAGEERAQVPADGFAATDVRGRSYVTGAALGFLLDRLGPGWQTSLEADDGQFLDGLLAAALQKDRVPEGEMCGFGARAMDDVEREASRDVAAVNDARVRHRERFDARSGWRLVVFAAGGEPMWPRGFDPLNVERVEGGILHTRFLRLGNEAGELEAVDETGADLESLTEGVGPHPLFHGIARVTVVGLSEPEIGEEGESVTIRAPGLSARFRNATAEVLAGEEEVLITISPPDRSAGPLAGRRGKPDRAAPGPDAERSTLELGRRLTRAFYATDLDLLWERMTAEMRAAAGGSVEEFGRFRERVAELAGDEVEVFHEEVAREADLDVYRRTVRFDGTPEPMVVQWGLDWKGRIQDFFIRPSEPATEVAYETRTELHLPFEGEWYVTAGGRTVEQNHHTLDYSNRFAYDLVSAEEFERSGPRTRNEDFATWGRSILAPAAGIVAAVRDGVPDNPPGEINQDPGVRIGNFVSVDHGNGEFSVLGHLRMGSVRVASGDRVGRGDVLGLAGNSGNSNGPHLHYNLQDRPEPNRGRGLPAQFRDLWVDGRRVVRAEPVQGQRIRPP